MPSANTSPSTIKWTKTGEDQGETEWNAYIGDEWVASLSKSRATKWHGNGVSGLVLDWDAPVMWGLTIEHADKPREHLTLADGLHFNTAKKRANALIGREG